MAVEDFLLLMMDALDIQKTVVAVWAEALGIRDFGVGKHKGLRFGCFSQSSCRSALQEARVSLFRKWGGLCCFWRVPIPGGPIC